MTAGPKLRVVRDIASSRLDAQPFGTWRGSGRSAPSIPLPLRPLWRVGGCSSPELGEAAVLRRDVVGANPVSRGTASPGSLRKNGGWAH